MSRLYEKYADAIAAGAFGRDSRLLIPSDGSTNAYYAPFDAINPEARLVLVGITPGPTQMELAMRELQQQLAEGTSIEPALYAAKRVGAFGGEVFRSNLVRQLDAWGVPTWLGIEQAADLFGDCSRLLHTTSLLRYPVFVGNAEYNGTPNMLRDEFLKDMLMRYFVPEARLFPEALFFSLGPKVATVLNALTEAGVIRRDQVINGILHGSGNNTYRINYLTGDRRGASPPYRTNVLAWDRSRSAFCNRVGL